VGFIVRERVLIIFDDADITTSADQVVSSFGSDVRSVIDALPAPAPERVVEVSRCRGPFTVGG
jgi:hypothetical protein